jgi:RNA polymerase sigma factor (sigma-70 family)
MAHPEDQTLVEHVLHGDPKAAAALDARLRQVAGAVARRVNLDRARPPFDQDDLVQAVHSELFARDRKVLRSYSGQAALGTWLYTIAYRRALRAVRQRPRLEPEQPHQDDSPAHAVARGQTIDQVRAVLAELPADDQLLVQLLFDREVPPRTVAGMLGITPDGVRMRKMRLLRRLSKRLKGLWP